MSPPIRDGSGSSIGSIRLGDGSEISEVRTGAGDVLFSASAIPDSTVLNLSASDYDSNNNEFKSNIGPSVPDASGDPSVVADDINGFDAVQYDGSDDGSQTTTTIATASDIVVIFTARISDLNDNGLLTDGASGLSFGVNDDSGGDDFIFFANSNNLAINYGHDTNYHVYGFGFSSGTQFFEQDNDRKASASATSNSLDGFSIGMSGGKSFFKDMHLAEATVLESFTPQDLSNETLRQADKYDIAI